MLEQIDSNLFATAVDTQEKSKKFKQRLTSEEIEKILDW